MTVLSQANGHRGCELQTGLLELAGRAKDPPDGWRARGVVCPLQDSLLVCRAGAASEAEHRPRWNAVYPEAVAAGDLGAWVGWAEACLCEGYQEQPGRQRNAKTLLSKGSSATKKKKTRKRWGAGGRRFGSVSVFLFTRNYLNGCGIMPS